MAGIIVAGYDKNEGGSVFSIPLGGSMHKQPFTIGGSGSAFIYGFCDENWKDGMTKEEAIKFAMKGLLYSNLTISLLNLAVALAMSRDNSSGGTIRLAVVTKDGVERKFIPGSNLPQFYM